MKILLLFGTIMLSFNSFLQILNIPDSNFKSYLVLNTAINTNGDTEIQLTEANTFTGYLDCSNSVISDLTGIEAFVNLTALDCSSNQLTSLNVSQNIFLIYLICYENILTSLNVTPNTDLKTLFCGSNQLTSLDITQNLDLEDLDIKRNQITSIDVTQNLSLNYLNCKDNLLASIDVTQNSEITIFDCGFNQLTSLDITHNPELWRFDCILNNLTSLDVSQNYNLVRFSCSHNQITSIDLSHCIFLTEMRCWDNQLICLNVKNGNNHNINQYGFNSSGNPNLNCIEVDNATYSILNWNNVDTQVSFSTFCGNDCSNDTSSLNESFINSKQLLKIVDIIGNEVEFKHNTPLIYIYTDGTTEKAFKIE